MVHSQQNAPHSKIHLKNHAASFSHCSGIFFPWDSTQKLPKYHVLRNLAGSSLTRYPSRWKPQKAPQLWNWNSGTDPQPKKTTPHKNLQRNIHPPDVAGLHWVSVPVGGRPYTRQKKQKQRSSQLAPFFLGGIAFDLCLIFFLKIMLPFPKLFWWRFGCIMGTKIATKARKPTCFKVDGHGWLPTIYQSKRLGGWTNPSEKNS